MYFDSPVALIIFGVLAVITIAWVGRHFFSTEARRERRRRRSNTRLASTAKRPTVRFSVRTKRDERK